MAGITYGLVKGLVTDFKRHEDVPTRNPHFHVVVTGGGKRWRCPINVQSSVPPQAQPNESEVWFKIQQPLPAHPLLNAIRELPAGLKKLPERKPGLTLDYVREPFFDRTQMRRLPFLVDGPDNDIQDLLESYVRRAQTEHADVYVFGEYWEGRQFPGDMPFGTDSGVHDVHMNQGNNRDHRGDDGIYQDGALLIEFPFIGWVGIFLAFNSQVWATDDQGHRKPGFGEGPLAPMTGGEVDGTPGQAPPTRRHAVIVAALVNPEGDDRGMETVTIFNASNAAIDLNGWSIVDRQNRAEVLGARTLPSNEAVTVILSGNGALLGNNGGTIRLLDAQGTQLDARTYSNSQVSMQGEILVF